MGRDAIQLGGRLLLVTLVAALLLAGTYLIAKEPIERQRLAVAQSAQRAVLPEAEVFQEMPVPGGYPLVTALYAGKAGEDTVGYVLTAAPHGYAGPIPITMGVGIDGSIRDIAVGDLQETANIGTKIAEEPFLSQYDALPADPEVIGSEVDTIAGVTVSSAPFKRATVQMAALTKDALGVEPRPGIPKIKPPAGEDLPREEQLSAALDFEDIALPEPGDYKAVQSAQRAVAMYRFVVRVTGYTEEVPILMQVDVDAAGNFLAFTVLEHAETPGIGTPVFEEPGFAAQFVGKPAAVETLDEIQAISGATVTSDAVVRGLRQAVRAYRSIVDRQAIEEVSE